MLHADANGCTGLPVKWRYHRQTRAPIGHRMRVRFHPCAAAGVCEPSLRVEGNLGFLQTLVSVLLIYRLLHQWKTQREHGRGLFTV